MTIKCLVNEMWNGTVSNCTGMTTYYIQTQNESISLIRTDTPQTINVPVVYASICSLLLRLYLHLGSALRVFSLHGLRSCASVFTCFAFMSFFFITSLFLSFGLPILRCPLTSMLSLLHLPQYFSSNVLTISISFLLFSHLVFPTWILLLFRISVYISSYQIYLLLL